MIEKDPIPTLEVIKLIHRKDLVGTADLVSNK